MRSGITTTIRDILFRDDDVDESLVLEYLFDQRHVLGEHLLMPLAGPVLDGLVYGSRCQMLDLLLGRLPVGDVRNCIEGGDASLDRLVYYRLDHGLLVRAVEPLELKFLRKQFRERLSEHLLLGTSNRPTLEVSAVVGSFLERF